MIRQVVLILWLASPALRAEVFPALYDVTGVASDDVLNIRARPDATSDIIGTLSPDATGIEVVAVSGDWAVVNAPEMAGYVALRFLRREASPDWNALETPLTCLGTEPFWSLKVDPAAKTANLVASDDLDGYTLKITNLWPGTAWTPSAAVSIAEGFAVLAPAACSDGMSDRSYGISLDLFLHEPEIMRLSGCCTLGQP